MTMGLVLKRQKEETESKLKGKSIINILNADVHASVHHDKFL
jgi:hypothetical protein